MGRATSSPDAGRDPERRTVRADDDLVSLRTHELRTPLASMVGFAELLESGDLTEEQRQLYAGVLLREGRRLDALINNAVSLHRLETGGRAMDLAPVDLHALVERAVAAAGEDAERPIHTDVAKHLPLVSADTEAILEVLGSFLANARRFSPDGGAIRIGARAADHMVQVHIQDHGVGIQAAALPSLFRKFYRADSGVRRLGPGAGLGLAMSHRIIEAHSGHVEVASRGPGKGARFQFTLPISSQTSIAPHVLVIEDNAGFASLLKAEFALHGISTVRAADAETAERMLMESTPRAIVLDLRLPGLQGEDFLARVTAGKAKGLPIVVMTVKDMSAADIRVLESAGAMAVLPKEAGAPQAAVALIAEALDFERAPG